MRRLVGDGVGEREVDGPRRRAPGGPPGPRSTIGKPCAAFEARPVRSRGTRCDVGGRGQRAPLQQRAGDDVELVPAEVALGLEEGGGAGQLADRELRHRLRLARRAQRLVALHRVEVVVFVGADDQRRDHRAGGDRRTAARPSQKRRRMTYCRPSEPDSPLRSPGTAASDSQR